MGCAPSDFVAAMRRYPASVSIVATGRPGQRVGMTVSAVCSLTAEPPQLLTSMNLSSGTTAAIRAVGRFSVNVLREDQAALAVRFASRAPGVHGEARFAEGDWCDSDEGVPFLADAAQSFLCRSAGQMETATHLIMIGAVEQLVLPPPGPAPVLMYHDGAWGHFSAGAAQREIGA